MFIAEFHSYAYPEDTKILGIFSTEEKAENTIQDAIAFDKEIHPGYPARYQQRRSYYNIAECELDERII